MVNVFGEQLNMIRQHHLELLFGGAYMSLAYTFEIYPILWELFCWEAWIEYTGRRGWNWFKYRGHRSDLTSTLCRHWHSYQRGTMFNWLSITLACWTSIKKSNGVPDSTMISVIRISWLPPTHKALFILVRKRVFCLDKKVVMYVICWIWHTWSVFMVELSEFL